MDFDLAKENIQPLRQGRRADRLELALNEQSKESLESEKKQYEEAIGNYDGIDPLSAWYEYICWIEQSYPKGGSESGLDEVVLRCILNFEAEPKYKQDRRMIKLYIKYIDNQKNPNEYYSQLYNNGIGTMVADLYIAWSYYFDGLNNFKEVEAIFRKGIDAGAQPLDELAQAHQAFSISMSRRMLYDDETSQQQFQASLAEKRSALTSLRAHKKKFVGSLRTGIAVKDNNPGTVSNENAGSVANKNKFEVLETEELAALPANVSVIRSIVDSARKNENVHEPGPWNKAKMGKHGNRLFGKVGASNNLDFAILEDDNLVPIPCPEKLFEKGIQLPSRFVSQNEPQKPWNVPMFVQEPLVPRAVPCYEKFFCYPNDHTEIAPDEYRGYKWFKDRNMTTKLTEQYDKIFLNTFETSIRLPPGFQICNVKQIEKIEFDPFMKSECDKGIQLPIDKMFIDGEEELSQEELLAEKFKEGKIKLLTEDDFEEIDDFDNMDLTLIGDRRQSYYPTNRYSSLPRKSIMPRKSVMPPPTVEEEAEEETLTEEEVKSTGAIRKSSIKRKSNENVDEKPSSENMFPLCKKELVCETPPRSSFNLFKPPAPVEKKPAYPFVLEDEEQNESCSTMQFNYFLQAQSASTPMSRKNIPKLMPLATLAAPEVLSQQNENEPKAEGSISSNHCSLLAPVSTTQPQEVYLPKQLSTIMETTESTQSTKSSVGNETEFNMKTPKNIQKSQIIASKPEVESNLFNPLLASFRLGEEQTETAQTIPIRMITHVNGSQIIPKTPMKIPGACSFQIFEDDSLPLPPQELGVSIKSQVSSNSSKQTEVTQIEIKETQQMINEIPCLSTSSNDNDDFEVPSTDDDFEIPATQDFEVPPFDSPSLPSSENQETARSENSQNSLVLRTEVMSISDDVVPMPLSSDTSEMTELKSRDIITISSESTTISSEAPNLPIVAVEKPTRNEFSIYEDSVREEVKLKQPNVHQLVSMTPNVIASDSLHMSCKENFLIPPASQSVRTPSDEFLAMCASPVLPTKMNRSNFGSQIEVSDLLKFSNVTAGAALDLSLEKLLNEPPRSATPTANLFDDDMNTEKFTMSLGSAKNSTLIVGEQNKNAWNNDLDISVCIESEEMERLGLSTKRDPVKNEFKVPNLPPFKPTAKPVVASEPFEVYEDDDDLEENDLSRSIYKPAAQEKFEIDDDGDLGDEMLCSFKVTPCNQYEHTVTSENHELSLKVQKLIQLSNGNPFDQRLREAMLDHCNFSHYLENEVKYCTLLKHIPLLKPRVKIECKDNEYTVIKFIDKGSYGSIFKAKSSKDGKVYALKQEQPPNLWEFYITLELFDRLKDKRMLPAFLHIDYAFIAHNSSIHVTQFSPYGTILNVCNKHKHATNKNIDEYVVMVLTTQLLSILDHLHACKIIHGDIKPDNFLMMSQVEYGMRVPALQLIDFGTAIDMDWYDPSQAFTYIVETENFTCCEMLEKKPWTYQTDLFGLAGTSHVMLFGKYMQVEKKVLTWNTTSRFPRYFNKILWEQFFNTLLNIQSCSEMPNLQALKDQFEDFIQSKQKFIIDKIAEFNKAVTESN